jgi:hypothetical protein
MIASANSTQQPAREELLADHDRLARCMMRIAAA